MELLIPIDKLSMADQYILVSDDDEPAPPAGSLYTGAFSIFNRKERPPSSKEGSIIHISLIPPTISSLLTASELSVFYESDNSVSDWIFGPLQMSLSSPAFSSSFTVSDSVIQKLHASGRALGFCVQAAYFWPLHFNVFLNGFNQARPGSQFNRESANYWMDVSSSLRSGQNDIQVQVQHPRGESDFYFAIRLFERRTDQFFIDRIETQPHSTLDEWEDLFRQSINADSEVVFSRIVISLMCPLGLFRIDVPVRGVNCRHLACMDLVTFIRYQRENGDWSCPICGSGCRFEDLRIDDCLAKILGEVPGEWESAEVTEFGEVKPP
jgi:hypothetical protein